MKKGWEIKTLGEVCQFINRGICPKYMEAGGACVLNQKCVKNQTINFSLSRRHDVTAKKISPERILRHGDVLINSTGTGTLGRVAQLLESPPEVTTVDSHVTIVRPINSIFHPSFFGYAIIAIEEQLQGAGEGCGGQTELARTKLATDFTVRYPTSISEQQRIVAILDEAFEGITKAKANAEQNLKNARELFESHLQAVFSQRGEGGTETNIASEVDLLAGFAFKSSQYTESTDSIRLLRGDNIIPGSIRWDDVKFWSASDTADYERYQLKVDDVVLAMDRPWIKDGLKRALIADKDIPCLQVQRTARLRSNGHIHKHFLYYLISSRAFIKHILGSQTGIGVPHISGKQIGNFKFFMPKFDEQKHIVEQLRNVHSKTQRLESIYQRKIAALDELKNSLLHKAFSGEL